MLFKNNIKTNVETDSLILFFFFGLQIYFKMITKVLCVADFFLRLMFQYTFLIQKFMNKIHLAGFYQCVFIGSKKKIGYK